MPEPRNVQRRAFCYVETNASRSLSGQISSRSANKTLAIELDLLFEPPSIRQEWMSIELGKCLRPEARVTLPRSTLPHKSCRP